uniref:Uncharacterized protein n=1 Tax=Rhizophora mucronata TaxID=61149 RepID=A0A2P2L3P1_RHIMU
MKTRNFPGAEAHGKNPVTPITTLHQPQKMHNLRGMLVCTT